MPAPPTAIAVASRRRFPSPVEAMAGAAISWRSRAPAAVALGGLVLAAVIGAPAAHGAEPEEVTYRPPVLAPITNHFRAPEHPYGPGNRGIDYATRPGTAVTAAAEGRVTFAGAVAGRLIVVILHRDATTR